MKSLYLRSCLALALAAGLAACGGGNDNLLLTGSVISLTKDGLVLQNNGGQTVTVPAGASSFIFPERIGTESDYEVTIKTQPTGAKCEVRGGKGRAGMYNVTNTIFVLCTTNAFNLGGTVTGLTAASTGLVLANGADTLSVAAGATSFTMPTKVADGAPYGVTVLTQPAGRSCSVADGVGLMGSADLTSVKVSCN